MNPFIVQLLLRTWVRILVVSGALALILVLVSVASGASALPIGTMMTGWWATLFPLASGIATVDLWIELDDSGELTGASSIGVPRGHLVTALVLPWLLLTVGVGAWQAHQGHLLWANGSQHADALSLSEAQAIFSYPCDAAQIDSRTCASIDAMTHVPSPAELRATEWSKLPIGAQGNIERGRRWGEPFLSFAVAPISFWILRRRKRQRGGARARALIATLLVSVVVWALWSVLAMVLLSSFAVPLA